VSAKLKSLITIGYVTDHDCGNYYLGEIDSLVQVGALEDFLKLHGDEGANGCGIKLAQVEMKDFLIGTYS
jgi:hypothetical protein